MANKQPFIVVVPVLDTVTTEHMLPVAAALARAHDGWIALLGIVHAVAHDPFIDVQQAMEHQRDVLNRLQAQTDVPVVTLIRAASSWQDQIRKVVNETGARVLVLGWHGETMSSERVFGPPITQLLAAPPCDVLVVRQRKSAPLHRILLPIAGGPNTQLSVDVATNLADAVDGLLTVLVANDPQHPIDGAVLQDLRSLEHLLRVDRYEEPTTPALPALLAEVQAHDVVIIGATGQRSDPALSIGTLAEAVLRHTDSTVIITRHKLTPSEQRTVAQFEARRDGTMRVDTWFAERTFNGDEFADVEQLVALKQQQGVTISLMLPALNEAATIGPLIDALKTPLLDEVPLLDEIVLVDSHSTDDTRAIAAARGIPVYVHQQVLPQYGAFAGKGEALWKSLHVAHGDIIVWLDTDIHHIHPRFVYGLVGPLLHDPHVHFAKGFYRRPIKYGDHLLDAGGGRVTELVARPLFNLFFPALSGFIQPLSGEYAGRRSVLERQAFFTGYGVETGLLIDLLHDVGLEGMAQVDLQQRIHRNQALHGLSQMAFAIIQVVVQRLEERERLHLLDPINQSLKLIAYAQDGDFHLDVHHVRDHLRLPMMAIPEYRERRRQARRTASVPNT